MRRRPPRPTAAPCPQPFIINKIRIELCTETETLRKYLKPGEKPVAEFKTDAKAVTAREYCNLHGLWKGE